MAAPDPGELMRWPADDILGLMRVIDAMPGRRVQVPGTLNFRDAGGYPAAGGGAVGWRRLLRSDALHRLDGTAADVLGPLGLRTVLDLRTSYEADLAPSPLDDLARLGALTMHVSLIGEDLGAMPAELGDIYDYVVDERGAVIGSAIRSLARPGALPGLVHCTAGKDRTGIVVAFALAAIGVPDHIVAADYALSSLYLDPQHTPTIGHVQESTGLGDRLTAALLASPPELMLRVLERARRGGGSVEGYLARYGVTAAELGALRSALLPDWPAT
ncbi:MAG TPA: tyrosine-protein phosphatase [Streptosporangiaceae bacterium]